MAVEEYDKLLDDRLDFGPPDYPYAVQELDELERDRREPLDTPEPLGLVVHG